MTRFLLCSFATVLLYPSGIDMYLVGLPRITQDTGASEAQLHIAFSVYLAGMASAMLFAGRIADRSGRKPVAIVGAAIFVIASLLCARAHTSSHFLIGRFIQDRRRQLLRGGFRYPARYAGRPSPRQGAVVAQRHHLHYPRHGAGAWPPDYAEISVAEPVLHDDRHGRHGRCAVGLYPA